MQLILSAGGLTVGLAFVQQMITAYVLAHFSCKWRAAGVGGALFVAFSSWLLVALATLNSVLWERKSTGLYLFNLA